MPPKKKEDKEDDAARLRIAIVQEDRCKPKKCKQECKKFCPVVRTGKLCVEAGRDSKIAWISETLCIGCGICVKRCPFQAIMIINLPKDLGTHTTHRYGPNSFKLHRLPTPRPGQVLGLIGTNGIGKSTALKILAGKLKPNLGKFEDPPEWQAILTHFRGSELQSYFTKVLEDKLKATIKPQFVELIPKMMQGTVGEILEKKDERECREELLEMLDLGHLVDRQLNQLSGGELQRFACAVVAAVDAQVYMFDEPSSYLDVRQRLRASKVIRRLLKADNYVILVEHDLAVIDYLSDFVCCLWGAPGAYGVVTMPFSVREGINIFLDGFIPTENMRFREVSLTFRTSTEDKELVDQAGERTNYVEYPQLEKKLGDFMLRVEPGNFAAPEILVMLGQNGCGKTTFIRMLAGLLKPDTAADEMPTCNVSYKPQTISAKFEGTVRELLGSKIRDALSHPQFNTDVVKPMQMETLFDYNVQTLSGGEMQRVAIVLALGKPADIYLLDEPSAHLDVEQRIVAARVIKRYIMHAKKTAFVVEHDFIMATYLADRVIVYTGEPGIDCTATTPQPLVSGMNQFLAMLEITFRRDPTNHRPRINKDASQKDQEQKKSGNHFCMDDDNSK
jgi:ATP-binding cassette subfamily E protein 1